MTADEVNGIDPLDLPYAEHDDHMAVMDLLLDYAPPSQACADRAQDFTSSHHRGEAATTTVEARGCPNPMPGCREHNPAGDVGRAAGALLTGQRQDGPSCDPAYEQYPRVAHGDAGALTLPQNNDDPTALNSRAV